MCLLVAVFRAHPDAPLIFAANRDEWLARPASAMERLRERDPRTLGGRDGLAGGTWLAVNEHGVVAALTNQTTRGDRDPSRKSRGEIPMLLTAHARARAAANALAATVRAEDYNPCWVLVGDRDSLHYLDLSGQGPPAARELSPGVHVLENQPLDSDSTKAAFVRARVEATLSLRGEALREGLWRVLGDHTLAASDETIASLGPFAATRAACVHAGSYGTRWSALVQVGAERGIAPDVRYADGRPCEQRLQSAAPFWT